MLIADNIFEGKKVLVAGGTGMIGQYLVTMLLKVGAKVRVASLDDPSRANPGVEFIQVDLTNTHVNRELCKGMDMVFNLLGAKGSPDMTAKKPASFFVPSILCNTITMESAFREGVERFLYTSTIGVYQPAEILKEDDVWSTFPSPHDRFAGWAKRMGELQAEAYKIQYGWDKIAIVRPANVYGCYDNFDLETGMVVPSLIRKVVEAKDGDEIEVWGDGNSRRDFVHAQDVASGMMLAMEKMPEGPINLGSGIGILIRYLINSIIDISGKRLSVRWDTTKPSGDLVRVMDISKARDIGFAPSIDIKDGIREVMDWYRNNISDSEMRYNEMRRGNGKIDSVPDHYL